MKASGAGLDLYDRLLKQEHRLRRVHWFIALLIIVIFLLFWLFWQRAPLQSTNTVVVQQPSTSIEKSAEDNTSKNATATSTIADALAALSIGTDRLADEAVTFEKIDFEVWEEAKEILGVSLTLESILASLTDLYVKPTDTPAAGSIAGTFLSGFSIGLNAITLGTHTTGNYVEAITTGDGLSGDVNSEGAMANLTIQAGDGIVVNASGVGVRLAASGGLIFVSGELSLPACSDGQILKRIVGAWTCASDNFPATAYQQHLSGADNRSVGATLTPLLTNGSGTPQSLPVTITSGNKVTFQATIEISSTLVAGPVTYVVIRDDNSDNDCVTGGGDGTQVGGQATSFVSTAAQSFTTSFGFADAAPGSTTPRYQLCASTSIASGTTTVTDRSLRLEEASF